MDDARVPIHVFGTYRFDRLQYKPSRYLLMAAFCCYTLVNVLKIRSSTYVVRIIQRCV